VGLLIILFSDLVSFLLIADYRIGELIFLVDFLDLVDLNVLEFLVFILVGQSRAGWSSRSDRCVFFRFDRSRKKNKRSTPARRSCLEPDR
jgi:hypothetical protein